MPSNVMDNQIYPFGTFFGRNIDLMTCETPYDFLSAHIYDYMKSKRYFELGLGHGVGEIFHSLDYPLLDQILGRLEIDDESAKGLGDGLGFSFLALDKERQFHIQVIIRKSIPGTQRRNICNSFKKGEFSIC